MDEKGGRGWSVRWKAWWRQSNIKCAVSEEYSSCWVHQDCHVADEEKAALKKAAEVSGRKDECQVRLKGEERDHWMGTKIGMLGGYGFQRQKGEERDHGMGTKIGMLGGYGFQRQVTAGDGSDNKGKMGAGYNNLREKKSTAKWHKRTRA